MQKNIFFWSKDEWAKHIRPGSVQSPLISRDTFNGPSYSGLKAQWPQASSILTLIPLGRSPLLPEPNQPYTAAAAI